MIINLAEVDSPIGTVRLAVRDGRLCAAHFEGTLAAFRESLAGRYGASDSRESSDGDGVASALRAYFSGDLQTIESIAVDPAGTEFQQRVWSALRAIRAGETISYSGLARSIGAPHAVRAVGAANGANPIPIVIPCHRVVGSDGRLVGYGGGLHRKEWLLTHEGARLRFRA
jgi:methylated-DNA-[protein]-cysteine S-methyltransferase